MKFPIKIYSVYSQSKILRMTSYELYISILFALYRSMKSTLIYSIELILSEMCEIIPLLEKCKHLHQVHYLFR